MYVHVDAHAHERPIALQVSVHLKLKDAKSIECRDDHNPNSHCCRVAYLFLLTQLTLHVCDRTTLNTTRQHSAIEQQLSVTHTHTHTHLLFTWYCSSRVCKTRVIERLAHNKILINVRLMIDSVRETQIRVYYETGTVRSSVYHTDVAVTVTRNLSIAADNERL